MTKDQNTPTQPTATPAPHPREERVAEALRANLRRRKEQQQARRQAAPNEQKE